MANYYKGTIINVNMLKTYAYNLDFIDKSKDEYSRNLYMHMRGLLVNNADLRQKHGVDEIINSLFQPKPLGEIGESVYYTKVYDKDGNVYGKEVVSGLVFPLQNDYSSFDITYHAGNTRVVYYDSENNVVYSHDNANLCNFYIIDCKARLEQNVQQEDRSKLIRMDINETNEVLLNGKPRTITCLTPNTIGIRMRPKMIFPEDKIVKYALTGDHKVTELEVSDYLLRFNHGLGRREREREHCNTIGRRFMSNNLGNFIQIDEDTFIGMQGGRKI